MKNDDEVENWSLSSFLLAVNEWNYCSTKNWRILILFIGFFLKLAQKQPNPSLFLLNKYIFHLFCFNPLYVLGLHQKIFKYVISKFEKKSVQNKKKCFSVLHNVCFSTFQLVFRLTSAEKCWKITQAKSMQNNGLIMNRL